MYECMYLCMFSGRLLLFKVSYYVKYSLLAVALVPPHSGHCRQKSKSLAE